MNLAATGGLGREHPIREGRTGWQVPLRGLIEHVNVRGLLVFSQLKKQAMHRRDGAR